VLSVVLVKSSDSEDSVVPAVDVIGVEKLGMPRPAGAAFADDATFATVEVFEIAAFDVEVFEAALCAGLDDAVAEDAAGAVFTSGAVGALAGTGAADTAEGAAGSAVRLIATEGNFSSSTTIFETGIRITIKAIMNQKPSDKKALWMSLFLSDSSIVFILSCASSRR